MNGLSEYLLTLAGSLLFVGVHLFSGKLRFLEGIPRSRWLSGAGGVSVAYVFLHLLPELHEGQETLAGIIESLSSHAYLIALVGLLVFYGIERYALQHRNRGKGSDEAAPPSVFWIHIVSFALYNLLVGYLLLHREQEGRAALLWYIVAMALHFMVNDYGLREHHKHRYTGVGRWLLSAAILTGWGLGVLIDVPEPAVIVLFAFLAGGIILNVLKEELPEERQSRFWAFAFGAGLYAALLLVGA